jgi:hypothetical protein
MDNGKMEKKMALGFLKEKWELTKVYFKMGYIMERVSTFLKMEMFIKVTFCKIKEVDKVFNNV